MSRSHCWESLADAYYGRGAYTAALKSYQRVLEIDPDAVYPAFQMGTIKQVSLHIEARTISEHGHCLVATMVN